jgi:hypothetical protein
VRAELLVARFEPKNPFAGILEEAPDWPLNLGSALVSLLIGGAGADGGPSLGYLIVGGGMYTLGRYGIDGSPTVGLNIGGGVELDRFKRSLYVDVRFHLVPSVGVDGAPFAMVPFTLGVKF